jgi:hypothetical protein
MVRVDTTVVAANVRYPTDAGLFARASASLPTPSGASKRPAASGPQSSLYAEVHGWAFYQRGRRLSLHL